MAKDSSRTTAGELQKKVEFQGQKTFKKIIKQHLHNHVVWEGFKKKIKKIKCFHRKNNLQHIQLSDTTGTSNGTGFYGQM